MNVFGRLWDAPVCDDATPVDTPVGVACLRCNEQIIDGDRGFIFPIAGDVEDRHIINADEDWATTAMHRECFNSEVMGHIVGVCSCTGWDTSARATGLEVQRRVDAGALKPR